MDDFGEALLVEYRREQNALIDANLELKAKVAQPAPCWQKAMSDACERRGKLDGGDDAGET